MQNDAIKKYNETYYQICLSDLKSIKLQTEQEKTASGLIRDCCIMGNGGPRVLKLKKHAYVSLSLEIKYCFYNVFVL